MLLARATLPALRPFVSRVWAGGPEACEANGAARHVAREHVLPTGQMHLVFRLSGAPLRLFDGPDDLAGRAIGCAVVGGARRGHYVRDVSRPGASVGAQLRPGAAELLFHASAEELAERHTPLEELWGHGADEALARLQEAHGDGSAPGRTLAAFEELLLARLPRVRALHPAVAHALADEGATDDVAALVRASGVSHRHFVAVFRRATGLSPKTFTQVRRFQRALERASRSADGWAEIAFACGYSDQAHLQREFLRFAGVTPGAWRRAAPAQPNHVRILQDARRGAR